MGMRLVLIVPIYAIAPYRVLMITESASPFCIILESEHMFQEAEERFSDSI
jgi:hypothetical protein